MPGLILDYLRHRPDLGADISLAGTAAVIGRANIGSETSLRDYATIRADGESIRVGDHGWFGEHATAHVADEVRGTQVGQHVTVGRHGIVHAATVGDGVVLGESAIVMDDASVGSFAMLAADSVVPPRKALPGGFLYAGHPAKPERVIDRDELAALAQALRSGAPAAIARSHGLGRWSEAARDLPPGAGNVLRPIGRRSPRVTRAFVAPTAIVAGDVAIDEDAGVFFGCVLCAGDARIVIGARTNVQDNSLLATDARRGDLVIGEGVTIGHNAELGSATIGDDALIGMGSRVGDNVIVERGGCVGAGAWVEPGTIVRAGWIFAGRPARAFRELKGSERLEFARARDIYIGYSRTYRADP